MTVLALAFILQHAGLALSAVSVHAPSGTLRQPLVGTTSGQDAPESADLAEKRREIASLAARIDELQKRWDEKYAEYQKMLANSGGRLNRAGQAKVAKLDAEAREIKAQIDAAKSELEELEEDLEDRLAEISARARREAEDARRQREEEERPRRERDPATEPQRPSDGRARGGEGDGARSGSFSGVPSRRAGSGASIDTGAPSDPTGTSETPRRLPALLDTSVWVFDPFDPVGGMGASGAEITQRMIETKFGKSSIGEALLPERVRYAGGGRRAIEERSFNLTEGSRPDDVGDLSRVLVEVAEGDLVRLVDSGVRAFGDDGWMPLAERAVDGTMERTRAVLRTEDRGDVVVTTQYHRSGSELGRIETKFERTKDARRPVEMTVSGEGLRMFRVGDVPEGGSSDDGTAHLLKWSYDGMGRVARLHVSVVGESRGVQFMLQAVDASGSDRADEIRRQVELASRSYEEWTYSYDAAGRLGEIVHRTVFFKPGMLDAVRLQSRETRDDEIMLRMLEQKLESDPDTEIRTLPGDGIVVERIDGGLKRIHTRVHRCTDWDSRGRWTKRSVFHSDEAGESEFRRTERAIPPDRDGPRVAGRHWQLFGMAPDASEDEHRRLALAFPGNGSDEAIEAPDASDAEASTSVSPSSEPTAGTGVAGLLVVGVAFVVVIGLVVLVAILLTQRRAK